MSNDWKHDRVSSALNGENPTVLAHLPAGFAAIGDVQWLPGYSVLLTDRPGIDKLSDLPRAERLQFLASVDTLASALESVAKRFDPQFRRVNIDILGNTDPFLHAHIWPRYEWEPEELRLKPVWLYPASNWRSAEYALGPQHDVIRSALEGELLSDSVDVS